MEFCLEPYSDYLFLNKTNKHTVLYLEQSG